MPRNGVLIGGLQRSATACAIGPGARYRLSGHAATCTADEVQLARMLARCTSKAALRAPGWQTHPGWSHEMPRQQIGIDPYDAIDPN